MISPDCAVPAACIPTVAVPAELEPLPDAEGVDVDDAERLVEDGVDDPEPEDGPELDSAATVEPELDTLLAPTGSGEVPQATAVAPAMTMTTLDEKTRINRPCSYRPGVLDPWEDPGVLAPTWRAPTEYYVASGTVRQTVDGVVEGFFR